ncbi:hypothetical protein GGI23_005454 [Coemansia sp. RSA 2559]|nr:hypothetical protein GGI23_005454 [Coemansia sp. RSA 2559]
MPKSHFPKSPKSGKTKGKPYKPQFKKGHKKPLGLVPHGKVPTSQLDALPISSKPPHEATEVATSASPLHGKKPVKAQLPEDASEQLKTAERTLYWCREPGKRVRIRFKGKMVLGIVKETHMDEGEVREANQDECEALVLGLCPFHVVAKTLADKTTCCGGSNIHIHETTKGGGGNLQAVISAASQMDTLDTALVTHPMPMNAILRVPELRILSLYVYEDAIYKKSYPDEYAKIEAAPPPFVPLDAARRFDYFVNPVCYRVLQQRAHEKQWKLDDSVEYSLANWANEIGPENVLFFKTGLRVPWPKAPQFRASASSYKISLCFWSEFQRQMWSYFLHNETGPCYLDAVYSCSSDGFQVWTLFFEYHNTIVPISYMVSTAITVGLVRTWLEAVTAQYQPLPSNKTIYVNSTKLVSELPHVFPDWNICYAKYYIVEEFKSLVLRPDRCPGETWDPQIVRAVKNIDIDLYSVMKTAVKPGTALANKVDYLVDKAKEWLPKPNHDLGLFNHSHVAVTRWRYLLWMTMLARPQGSRVDSVVYYLHKVLTAGIEAAVNAREVARYSSMDSMEQGSRQLKGSLAHARILPLTGPLVCVSDGRELSSKAIVDLQHKVCFCADFAQHMMCEHLVFCSSDNVHQPELVRLLETIPYA